MKLALLSLKIIFLGFIYIFLFRVFYYIQADLRRSSTAKAEPGQDANPPEGAEMVVIDSRDPSLKQGRTLPINGSALIGRGRHNTIRVKDSFVSHNHARINFRQGDYQLEDLGSINGTYYNGVRLKEPVLLRHGDTVRIAGVTFKFVRWENKYEVE